MKKLSLRDTILLFLLAVGLGFYLFFQYVYTPMNTNLKTKAEEKAKVQAQVNSNDKASNEAKLKSITEELNLEKEELKGLETDRIISPDKEVKMFHYIGEQAKKYNINLVKFEERPSTTNEYYRMISFDIQARGENGALILFLDSLYKNYGAFEIQNLEYRRVEVTSQYGKAEEGTSTEGVSNPLSYWDEEFIKAINLDIPLQLLPENQADETTPSDTEKEKTERPVTALQLDFRINFFAAK